MAAWLDNSTEHQGKHATCLSLDLTGASRRWARPPLAVGAAGRVLVVGRAASPSATSTASSSGSGSTVGGPATWASEHDAAVRRHAQRGRGQRPRPHGHGAGVLHRRLRARAHLRPAACQLPERCPTTRRRAPAGRRTSRRSPTPRPRFRPTANGGITDGGKVYTFHIKPGVDWDTTPARQVTADDFIREFKAFFNPVSPVGNAGYYDLDDQGPDRLRQRGDRLLRQRQVDPPTAANIAKFQNSHNIAGIKAVNSSTIQFTLTSRRQ